MASLEIVPRVLCAIPLAVEGATDSEALVFAIDAHEDFVIQFAVSEARLRSYSEEHPPTVTIPDEPSVEIALLILRHRRPYLAAAIDAAERRQLLRLVGGGPEAA